MAASKQICHRCGYTPLGPDERTCPNDGLHLITEADHLKAMRDPWLGRTLGGRYPILGVIGVGGMGTVYRSVQPLVAREVAIKVIHSGSDFESDEVRERFLREAQAIARLSHPAVVTLYDFGAEGDGTLFMVMEYVRGLTLYRRLRDTPVTARQIIQVGLGALGALQAAHAQSVIHRDIKPGNIMVLDEVDPATGGWLVKLLDFGLVRLLGSSTFSRLTQTGVLSGTPHYMAPEQVTGDEADERTDLYSLGSVLYEGLAGHPPFVAEHPMRLIAVRVAEPPPPLPDDPCIPPALAVAVMRSLAREPAGRFPSARAMADALAAVPLGPECDRPLLRKGPDTGGAQGSQPSDRQADWKTWSLVAAPEPQAQSGRGLRTALWVGGVLAALLGLAVVLSLVLQTDDRLPWRRAPAANAGTAGQPTAQPDLRGDAQPVTPSGAAAGAPDAGASASSAGRADVGAPAGLVPTLHVLRSIPPGAAVFDVAGRRLGVTPMRLQAAPGPGRSATYVVRGEAGQQLRVSLPLDGGEHQRTLLLEP